MAARGNSFVRVYFVLCCWLSIFYNFNRPSIRKYADLLVFMHLVESINAHPDILPNTTLGYIVYNTCGNLMHSLHGALNILSGPELEAPNYAHRDHGEVIGFVDDYNVMPEVFGMYGYTTFGSRPTAPLKAGTAHLLSTLGGRKQEVGWPEANEGEISYEARHSLSRDNNIYKSFFNTGPNDHFRLEAIIFCLKHFHWNWVGIFISFVDTTEYDSVELTRELARNGICVEYVLSLTNDPILNALQFLDEIKEIQKYTSKVAIAWGRFEFEAPALSMMPGIENITFILPETFIDVSMFVSVSSETINCSLVFVMEEREIPGIKEMFRNVNKVNNPGDPLLEDIYFYFGCNNTNVEKKKYFQRLDDEENVETEHCPDTLSPLTTRLFDVNYNYGSFYSIYLAVYSLVYAVQEMQRVEGSRGHGYRGTLQKYLIKTLYMEHSGEHITYSKDGELSVRLSLSSCMMHNASGGQTFTRRIAGTFTETSTGGKTFSINPEEISWKRGKVPISRCNDRCPPGSRVAPGNRLEVCCYECLPCAEGEMSNVTDSENCQRCLDEEWPNDEKTTCIPKTLEYLSFEEDQLALIFSVVSLLGTIITAIVLKVFISYWDSPVVKANNRTVSIILLASILLSFLCVFFFLGRPISITCLICVVWLSVSPPYQEYDMLSSPGVIIIQCNEGSVIGFYSVLGYMGFLAGVSFLLAFMVRTLPDSFNEAKYITFSMLVFCSVWIAMIPAYLSTRGKYMVAVEVFAILASSAGFLGCIFFPKLYIILLKPELNMKPVLFKTNT
ncbi:vomeronasal type-2 receptor 26-like [Hyperolius riggenbachi]|uniref:vomeronasal type-2 receptor 26-like n=1 Tax=Hyperolius riggenbachi TaxID=752182 RepID=UPI0035A36D07